MGLFKSKEEKIARKKYNDTHMNVKHQSGLPLAQDAECSIEYGEDKFVFSGSGNIFNLSFNKITDICVKTDEEIQKQYVSSIAGAVAGGMAFGALGAIIGGRVKEKKTKISSHFFIFTYKKDTEIDYISFELYCADGSLYYVSQAKEWIKRFKANHMQTDLEIRDL